MTISQYLKNIYTPNGRKLFHNINQFVAKILHAAGSNIDPKEYISAEPGRWTYQVYNGVRSLPRNKKPTPETFNSKTLMIFFEKHLLSNVTNGDKTFYVRKIMEKFGISEDADDVNCQCFFSALIDQLERLITDEKEDAEDIVAAKYREYKENPLKGNTNKRMNEELPGKAQFRYTLVIYEDMDNYRSELYRLCTAGNTEEKCRYYVDIPEHIVSAKIIQEDAVNEYDAFIIDLARPFMGENADVYTDFNYSGKDLYDELIQLRLQKSKDGPITKTAFFIYSTMANEKTATMFDYSSSAEFRQLSKEQQDRMRDSVECFFLNKETYDTEAVARRVRSYFDVRYDNDYFRK